MKTRDVSVILLAFLLAAMITVPLISANEQTMSNVPLPQLQPDNTQQKSIIHNGFSFSKADNMTNIPEGAIIQDSADGFTRVFDSGGKQILISNDANSPEIPTPGGLLLADRITQVPNGSYIQVGDNDTTNVFLNNKRILTVLSHTQKKTPIPSTSGWVEETKTNQIPSVSQFIAYWTVPTTPTNPNTGAISYIFNALQPPSTPNVIIQPVLEYNVNTNNHQWTGAPWYVDSSGHGYEGTRINTASGHVIEGQLLWNPNLQRWDVFIADEQTGGHSSEFSTNAPQMGINNDYAFCALEAYYVNNNSDIPGTITFTNMQALNANFNPIYFSWIPWVSTNMGLSNLGVASNGMSYVYLYT